MSTLKLFLIVLLFSTLNVLAVFLTSGCSQGVGFTGSTTATHHDQPATPRTPAPPPPTTPPPTPTPSLLGPFTMTHKVSTSAASSNAWVVTRDGNVTRITMDKAQNYPTKTWTFTPPASATGTRTYVTEIGLLMGVTGGYLYRADDDTGTTATLVTQFPDAASSSRVCVTSFKSGGQKFVGAAYFTSPSGQVGRLVFVRMPIDMSKPAKIDPSLAEKFDAGAGNWGYSCYTDQERNWFWSANMNSAPYGISLDDGKPLQTSQMPKLPHVDHIPGYVLQEDGSYAIGGGNGTVLSAGDMNSYTFTYEPTTNLVFGSWRSSELSVTTPTAHYVFPTTAVGFIGPISSLNDGRVLVLTRTGETSSAAYIVSLKNAADPAQGVDFEKLKDFSGDPYMYTDFTGATLYPVAVNHLFDLHSVQEFQPDRPNTALRVTWQAKNGSDKKWKGLSLLIRCFEAAEPTKPAFVDISASVADAGVPFAVTTPMCVGSVYDTVELKIEPRTTNGFSQTDDIQVTWEQ